MRSSQAPTIALFLALVTASPAAAAGEETGDPEPLEMTRAVACRSIEGYEDFEPLPDAELTSDEKLLVYYRPKGYQYEEKGGKFRAHLTQDARLRRKGKKAVLQSKDKLLDYEAKSARPPLELYLRNTISVKGLEPGDYELEIILHDRIGGGEARQSLPFRIVAAARDEADGKDSAGAARPGGPR